MMIMAKRAAQQVTAVSTPVYLSCQLTLLPLHDKLVGLMNKCWWLALLMVSSCLMAQTRSDAEGKLIAMENAWNTAQREHDTKALDALVSDAFINTEWDGSVENKAQFLQSIKDPSVQLTTMTNDDVSVFVYG